MELNEAQVTYQTSVCEKRNKNGFVIEDVTLT